METIKDSSLTPKHPGELLSNLLAVKQLSVEIEERTISALLHGKLNITPELSRRLEKCTGLPAENWLKSQVVYDQELLRLKYVKRIFMVKANSKRLGGKKVYF